MNGQFAVVQVLACEVRSTRTRPGETAEAEAEKEEAEHVPGVSLEGKRSLEKYGGARENRASTRAPMTKKRSFTHLFVLFYPVSARKTIVAVTMEVRERKHVTMVFWLIIVVLAFGVALEKRRRVERRLHTSYCGVMGGVEERDGAITLTLHDVSVGQAYSHGEHLDDLMISERASVLVHFNGFEQVQEYCQNWADQGDSVRIDMVQEGTKLAMVSITDQLGRGVIHGRPEFMKRGARGAA
jgi:hypothetical protein